MRVKCATMAWHTLSEALKGKKMSNLKEEVIKEIKIYDPEIPVNIYDLGLIYDISVKDKHVDIKMTLTSPNCPVVTRYQKM